MIYQAIDYLRYRVAIWLWCEIPNKGGRYSQARRYFEGIWRNYEERNP